MKSVVFENLEEAHFLFQQSLAIHGKTHPITCAAGTLVDYWFSVWSEEKGQKPMLSKEDLDAQIIDALLGVVIDQQHKEGKTACAPVAPVV